MMAPAVYPGLQPAIGYPAPRPTPAPTVRGAMPEATRPARPAPLVLPPPEQLGVGKAPTGADVEVDWKLVRNRIHDMGAVAFQLDRPAVGYRLTLWLPTTEAGKPYKVEGVADSEAKAVRDCLEKADRWQHPKP